MSLRARVCALLLAGLCQQAALVAQDAARPRLHIIGASVSGGFTDGPLFGAEKQGESVSLLRLLSAWCGDEAKVSTHPPMAMWGLFRDPDKIGRDELRLAARRRPDAVVAVDFLFWFAYGYVRGDPEVQRPARFERGLSLLDELEVPMVVGDLPDMRGAAARMLNERQIPSPAMLTRLNARLAAWSKARGDVTIAPVARLLRELKTSGGALPLADGPFAAPPGALLQQDRLHATRLGMALLAFRLQGTLQRQFPATSPLRARAWTFEQFVEAAGAAVELKDLRAGAAEKRR